MKTTSQQFGKIAEDMAAIYLQKQGFSIVDRNYRYKKAEIDIIAQKDLCLCFIEVKARTRSDFGFPEKFVTSSQQELIKQAAENYIIHYNWDNAIRFDIIALLQQKNGTNLVHFEDAFN